MKPMLAATTEGTNINYPVLASPKLDGIRALILGGKVMSRSLKPIPNEYIQTRMGFNVLNGLDGELIVGHHTAKDVFQKTTSGVMSIVGEPDVKFLVFDDFSLSAQCKFRERLEGVLQRINGMPLFYLIPHVLINNYDELLDFEERTLRKGYEGIMIRDPNGTYKYGRSTLKQGWLLKLKRFEDSEAEVIGYEPLMRNYNIAAVDALGHKVRSTKKAGKIATRLLGSIKVRDLKTGVEFDIGTGFSRDARKSFWCDRDLLKGRLVKYKYQSCGVKDKPRFPVFLGFRALMDL